MSHDQRGPAPEEVLRRILSGAQHSEAGRQRLPWRDDSREVSAAIRRLADHLDSTPLFAPDVVALDNQELQLAWEAVLDDQESLGLHVPDQSGQTCGQEGETMPCGTRRGLTQRYLAPPTA